LWPLSGFIIEGDVKKMLLIPRPQKKALVVAAVNNDFLRVFAVEK
jgi:hypothetical protein